MNRSERDKERERWRRLPHEYVDNGVTPVRQQERGCRLCGIYRAFHDETASSERQEVSE